MEDFEHFFDDTPERRGTDSLKWDLAEKIFGSRDVLPMWVADMDFPVAPAITGALQERLAHPVFGYTLASENLKRAIAERMAQKFSWNVNPEWILFTPGVVPAMAIAIQACTEPGGNVLVQSPVYPLFYSVIAETGRTQVVDTLEIHTDPSVHPPKLEHTLNRERFLKASKHCQMLLLSSPHNPGGKVWSPEELEYMASCVMDEGGIVLSDEIHHEIVYPEKTHVPLAALSDTISSRSITCIAPSKTFNIAGLAASAVIIPDPELRISFEKARGHWVGMPNLLGLTAFEAAYRSGDAWLSALLRYLKQNRDYALQRFGEIPGIEPLLPEATFLLWLDCRGLNIPPGELKHFFSREARVGLNPGDSFGTAGAGWMRLNFGCSRALLSEAISRIEYAVAEKTKGKV